MDGKTGQTRDVADKSGKNEMSRQEGGYYRMKYSENVRDFADKDRKNR